MLTTKPRFQTFAEYLHYEDNSEEHYELFNGELVEMPPESGLNFEIANFLFLKFASLVGHRRVRGHGLELEVRGEPKNRYPDLTIIREEHIQLLSQRNTILLTMAPPLLVIEVVSPGEIQRERDYIAKTNPNIRQNPSPKLPIGTGSSAPLSLTINPPRSPDVLLNTGG